VSLYSEKEPILIYYKTLSFLLIIFVEIYLQLTGCVLFSWLRDEEALNLLLPSLPLRQLANQRLGDKKQTLTKNQKLAKFPITMITLI
jgi:hypothetical protein